MNEPFFVDTECRNAVPIQRGDDSYCRTAECTIVTYASGDKPVTLWDLFDSPAMPAELEDNLADERVILVAHRAKFDRAIIQYSLKKPVPVERFFCTQCCAYSHGLPGSLETLGLVLGLAPDQAKLAEDGKNVGAWFWSPKADGTFRSPYDFPDKWRTFCNYAVRDTEALREVYKRLPKHNYSGENLKLYHLGERINHRGFGFDRKLALAAQSFLKDSKTVTDAALSGATGGAVQAATQRQRLLNYLNDKLGADIANLRASEIRDYLEQDDLNPEVRFLLETRLEAAKSSGSKYGRGLIMVGPQDRMRHTIQHNGAGRTGRYSHRGFQPGNLARPSLTVRRPNGDYEQIPVKAKYIDDVIIPGIYDGTALKNVEVYGGPNEAAALALRHVIVAAPGNELVVADFSNIESRVLAWLANQEWKLEAYRSGADLYRLLCANSLGIPLDEVDDNQRQGFKVVELACFAAETEVLTNHGYVAMVDVSENHLLWDGIEWVNHKGLVAKGVQPVVNVDGIRVTDSHLINCGLSWRTAKELVINPAILSQALVHGSANLPSPARRRASEKDLGSSCAVPAAKNTMSMRAVSGAGSLHAVTNAQRENQKLRISVNGIAASGVSCRTPLIGNGFTAELAPHSIGAIMNETQAILTTAVEVLQYAMTGGWIAASFWRILSPLKGGITRAWRWTARKLTVTTNREISDLSQNKPTVEISGQYKSCNEASQNWRDVYDIAYAGPRNRFTIRTNSGHLIVHNCGFGGGVGALVTMAAAYQMDLDALAPVVLPLATPKQLQKAYKAWRRAFLTNEDYALEPKVYQACDVLKQTYRESNDAINQFRYDIDNAVKGSIQSPGQSYTTGRCRVWSVGTWLIIELPSGRRLLYASPRINTEVLADIETGKPIHRESVSYLTARGKTWRREKAWAGLFVENIVQAVAADCLRGALMRLHADTLAMPAIKAYLDTLPAEARTAVSLHVHDEAVIDAPKGSYSLERMIRVITAPFNWSAGLPLAAAGWVNDRYGKR